MSDHDTAPDPIDEAYVRAEAMLSDDEARAARRARVLAAVEGAPTAAWEQASPPRRGRSAWRGGGWLTAASITAVCVGVFVTSQIYHPAPVLTGPSAPAHAPPASPAAPNVAPPAQGGAQSTAPAPTRQAIAKPPSAPVSGTPPAAIKKPQPQMQPAAPPPVDIAPAPPPPPPPAAPIIAPVPKAFPAAPPAADAPSERMESPRQYRFGNFSGGARDEVAAGSAESTARRASAPSTAEATVTAKSEALAAAPADQAARLRSAAAAGKTAEVEGLLTAGVPIDAADANGDTALIRSIQADQPSVATLLRRHGASLDHRNNAGQSARDIAKTKDDAELNQALGLTP